jgi:hypothetical protein
VSRTKQLTIALVVCLVLALIYLVNDIGSLNRKKVDLNAQISASSGILGVLARPATDTAARLTQAEKLYQTVITGVSSKVVPTEVIKTLLDLSDQFGFRVNPIMTEQWSTRRINNTNYRALPVNLSLDGQSGDLVKFIQLLENEDQFPYLVIENTQVMPINPASIDNHTFDSTLQIKITIIERNLNVE